MKKILKYALILTVFIGTFAMAGFFLTNSSWALDGTQASYLQMKQITIGNHTQTIYTIDLINYIKQLNDNLNLDYTQIFMNYHDPIEVIKTVANHYSQQLGNDVMSNIFVMIKLEIAVSVNYVIWLFNAFVTTLSNIILIPLKLAVQMMMVIGTILGIQNVDKTGTYQSLREFYYWKIDPFTIVYI